MSRLLDQHIRLRTVARKLLAVAMTHYRQEPEPELLELLQAAAGELGVDLADWGIGPRGEIGPVSLAAIGEKARAEMLERPEREVAGDDDFDLRNRGYGVVKITL